MEKRLTICLDDIPQEGLHVVGVLSPEVFALDHDTMVQCDHPLEYRLEVALVSQELLVYGALHTAIAMRCSRCTVFFPVSVAEASYQTDQEVDKTTESVDLTDDIREAIILAFPSYPICDTECKGLCPQCGANLNKSACLCKPPVDDRWAALDGLG